MNVKCECLRENAVDCLRVQTRWDQIMRSNEGVLACSCACHELLTAEDRQIIKQLATALRLEQVSESGLTQLFSMSEDELDTECRRLGIDPDGLAKRGLEAVRKAKLDFYHPGGVRPVNCHCEFCFTKEDAAEWDAEWMSAT